MSPLELEKRILATVSAALRQTVTPLTTCDNCDAWDSLKHIEVVFAVEDELNISFSEEEIAALNGVPALLAAAGRHLCATTI